LGTSEAALDCGKVDVRQSDYDRGIAPALIADSRLALQRGAWSQVQEDLKRYCAVSPVTAEVLFLKGEFLRRHPGKVEQGMVISAYEGAIGLDRNFAPAYRALGMVHFKLGRKAVAKRCFENYLTLIPDSADNLFIKDYLRQCTN
jgi:tetratricopeptide (TPR) repeat protein